MMKIIIMSFLLFCIWMMPNAVFANTGVFFGAGSQVIPIKNNEIQLVKEHVAIKLRIDEEAGNWGIPFFPRADVQAEFLLKNTSNKPIILQVGFPFYDLGRFGDEKLALSKLDFHAKDSESERKVTIKEGLMEKELDPERLFKRVFTWEEQFQPQQTKKITVSYRLLMGVVDAHGLLMRGFEGDGLKYSELDRLFPALRYSFHYLTKTAYTWKGPIENAIFTMDCSEFFQKIEQPDFVKKFGKGFPVGITRPVFLEGISPTSFTRDKDIFRWEFTGKVPEDGISTNFDVLFIPASSKEISNYLTEQVKSIKGGVTKDEYLSILKGYYARILEKDTKDEIPFTYKYFQPIEVLKSQLLFEKDQKSLSVIFDKLKALTTSLPEIISQNLEKNTLQGHQSLVFSVSFSPDGKTLASGSADKTIKLWNVADGKEIRTLTGHQSYVTSVSFTPDGKTLASGSRDETIKLWNVVDGQEIRTLTGHQNGVFSVSFSPDGKTLASGSFDKQLVAGFPDWVNLSAIPSPHRFSLTQVKMTQGFFI